MDLQVRILWFFVAEKRLQRLFLGLLQLFCCGRLCGLPPDPLIALTVTVRNATEYCLSTGTGDPVRNRNNRPLLCLALRHKSESLTCRLGLSRFDRRVQPNLSVLEDKWVALFCFRENH